MKQNNTLTTWEIATMAMTKEFLKQVFPENQDDYYWVCDDIGGVLNVGDHFIDIDRIVDYFRYNATPEHFFEYYDMELTHASFDDLTPLKISFKNFVLHGDQLI